MDLTVFQLKFYTFFKTKDQTILQLLNRIFPAILRTAKVIHIRKKNSKLEVSNCRPIYLISNIDKMFEKLMQSRLTEFLEEKQILYYRQFGFRNNFSTNHAILTFLESTQKALDNKQSAHRIVIDLKKSYGVRGISIDWFRSYLLY